MVTDDQGRYLIPDLPKATYNVWVRGYGLVDSPKVQSAPGRLVNHKAVQAPNPRAAAEIYPAGHWYSLARVPDKSEFPGTGPEGNGINPNVKSQADWLRLMKSMSCTTCHQLGTKGTRELPPQLGKFTSSVAAWERRILSGQAGSQMENGINNMGRRRALAMFADWTDRVAAGEVPSAPPRPQGQERNVVITQWDWADPKAYLHDVASTDRRNPTINANGMVYGLDFGNDYLGLVKAGVIASGLIPPSFEGSGQDLGEILRQVVGPGLGLEVVTQVNDIPKGSRLAVSTSLLAALISVCMRATGQAASLTGQLQEYERRLVLARAILGEWLGGGWVGFKNQHVASIVGMVLVLGLVLTGTWVYLWQLFGASNQMLAALSLLIVTVWLASVGKNAASAGLAMLFMYATTIAATVVTGYNLYQTIIAPGEAAAISVIGAWAMIIVAALLLVAALTIAWDGWNAWKRYKAAPVGEAAPGPTARPTV